MTRRAWLAIALVALALLGFWAWRYSQQSPPAEHPRIVINEAARTLLYLPLYHAEHAGYFRDEGVTVEIVTGGSATNSVAALISGEADIAQADPMYAAISQENGSDVVVIGQIVGRIGLWAVRRPGSTRSFDAQGIRGTAIITHPQPMTAFTYTSLFLQQNNVPANAVEILQARPGSEVATYSAERRADFLVGVEPVISILQAQGAEVVYSWPNQLGDRVFSGLMTRRETEREKADGLARVLRAYQRSLDDIRSDRPSVIESARAYFPDMDQAVVRAALTRLRQDEVFPASLRISEQSWNAAATARRQLGDIQGPAPYADVVDAQFIDRSLR